mgnify:CR=1 FL=1
MQDKESRYPDDWLRKADSDLKAAEVLCKAQNLEAAAFHMQQAIEKCLKGYLLSKGWRLRRIHELDTLLDEAIAYKTDFKKFRPICEIATEYYLEERYPFLMPSELNRKELQKILEETKELAGFIKREINKEK